MYYPSIVQIQKIPNMETYKKVPITKQIISDYTSPIEVLRVMRSKGKQGYLLESMENSKTRGRYTFLGYNPKKTIRCKDGKIVVDGKILAYDNPTTYLRTLLKEYHSPKIEGLPTFTGGLVGYFGYNYAKYNEPILSLQSSMLEEVEDMKVSLFDEVLCFDHLKQVLIIIVNIDIENLEDSYQKGIESILSLEQLVKTKVVKQESPLQLVGEKKELYNKEQFKEKIHVIKKHIYEGDIFQAVFSNRFSIEAKGSLFDMYRVLRTTNPSPYMFYIFDEDMEIAGASPETLVKVMDDTIYTYPLAGARPRGKDCVEDQTLEQELIHDEKELAEHNMLVDLGRNDIGKVSVFNSVIVEDYLEVVRFSHVMHLSSTVKGRIRKDVDALDALDAVLPAGTLSGAPKIKAMQILDTLETQSRDIYGGAIGYLDFTGNLDVCIAIRFAYKVKDTIYIPAGAGIVQDSNPILEYEECKHKARAIMEALKKAEGGIE